MLFLDEPTRNVVITEIHSHTFWQKFRESNVFTKDLTEEVISRDIFGESNFP